MAQQRQDHGNDDDESPAAHNNKWSLPKLLSLTNLALPILTVSDEDTDDNNNSHSPPSQKTVIDLVLFVCEIQGNKENPSDENKDTNSPSSSSSSSSSWWDRLSHPLGLAVAQERILPKTDKHSNKNNNDDDDDDDNDDDENDTPPPSHYRLPTRSTAAYMASNLATHGQATETFPLVRGDGGGGKLSSVYYYAWHKDELLLARDNRVHLERVILMEMMPTPDSTSENTAETRTTTSDERVRARLEHLLTRSSRDATASAPVGRVRIPPDNDKEQGAMLNDLSTGVALQAMNDEKLALDDQTVEGNSNTAPTQGEAASNVTEGTTTNGTEAASPPEAMDEIEAESPFVSEDYG